MENIVLSNNLDRLQASASAACALLKTLANEDRLLLLCQLSHNEQCVGDLEQATGVRQPTLSQQLGVLREQGLVATRREGKQIFYSVASTEAMAILQVLYRLFCGESQP